jgi:hypothetical protein
MVSSFYFRTVFAVRLCERLFALKTASLMEGVDIYGQNHTQSGKGMDEAHGVERTEIHIYV